MMLVNCKTAFILLMALGLASCEDALLIDIENTSAGPIQVNYSERVHTAGPLYDPKKQSLDQYERLLHRMDLADTTYMTRRLVLAENSEPDTPFAYYGLAAFWAEEDLDRAARDYKWLEIISEKDTVRIVGHKNVRRFFQKNIDPERPYLIRIVVR